MWNGEESFLAAPISKFGAIFYSEKEQIDCERLEQVLF
jgi:hypothetical protein